MDALSQEVKSQYRGHSSKWTNVFWITLLQKSCFTSPYLYIMIVCIYQFTSKKILMYVIKSYFCI
jgi:hypothetical protein